MINPDFYTTQHIELEVADLDIDEGLKDCILTTLERYEQLKAKLAEANETNRQLSAVTADVQVLQDRVTAFAAESEQYRAKLNKQGA